MLVKFELKELIYTSKKIAAENSKLIIKKNNFYSFLQSGPAKNPLGYLVCIVCDCMRSLANMLLTFLIRKSGQRYSSA